MFDLRDPLTYAKLALAVLAAFWSGLDPFIQALVYLMALDVLAGFLAGYITKTWSTEVSGRGIARKLVMLLLVAAAGALETPSGIAGIGKAAAGFLAAHEGLSLLEHAAAAGVPIPSVLRDALAKLTTTPSSTNSTPADVRPR